MSLAEGGGGCIQKGKKGIQPALSATVRGSVETVAQERNKGEE